MQGDLLDVDSLRGAFSGVSTLFLLNAVVPDEFTQALIALNLAREAGIERIVYLSVIHSDRYVNVPHFAGKFGVERMIEQMGFNATILRPAYFMNNDLTIKDVVTGYGVYPMPIGGKGLAMIDARDIGEIAAIELIRREQSADAAAARPDQPRRSRHADRHAMSPPSGRRCWAARSPMAATTPPASSRTCRQFMPSWMAFDMRLMSERFLTEGMIPEAGDVERLTALLGRPAALLSRLRLRDRRFGLTAQATRSIDSKERLAVDAEADPLTLRLPRWGHIARKRSKVCSGPTSRRCLAATFSVDRMVKAASASFRSPFRAGRDDGPLVAPTRTA